MVETPLSATGTDDPSTLDPVVEVYKKHVDRTLIREQFRRTTNERIERMLAALRLAEALGAAGRRERR
jgi:hypothetical protein